MKAVDFDQVLVVFNN